MPDYPLILAVENHRGVSPVRILELCRAGGVLMAYDEANIYKTRGEAVEDPRRFWDMVSPGDLTSIHLKQKGP